jgi:hypothetical protein
MVKVKLLVLSMSVLSFFVVEGAQPAVPSFADHYNAIISISGTGDLEELKKEIQAAKDFAKKYDKNNDYKRR